MRNKRLLYILLPAVVILWSIIAYKVIQHTNGPNEVAVLPDPYKNDLLERKDTGFTLLADYEDPFLKGYRIFRPAVQAVSETRPGSAGTPVNQSKPVIKWPDIQYGGLIINRDNASELYLLRINNVNNLMRPGDQLQNIQLVQVFRDSVVVRSEGEYKTVGRDKK